MSRRVLAHASRQPDPQMLAKTLDRKQDEREDRLALERGSLWPILPRRACRAVTARACTRGGAAPDGSRRGARAGGSPIIDGRSPARTAPSAGARVPPWARAHASSGSAVLRPPLARGRLPQTVVHGTAMPATVPGRPRPAPPDADVRRTSANQARLIAASTPTNVFRTDLEPPMRRPVASVNTHGPRGTPAAFEDDPGDPAATSRSRRADRGNEAVAAARRDAAPRAGS